MLFPALTRLAAGSELTVFSRTSSANNCNMADRDTDESKPFLDEEVATLKRSGPRESSHWIKTLPWMLAAASWSLTLYLLLVPRTTLPYEAPLIPEPTLAEQSCKCDAQNQTSFWPTDLKAMRPAIEYETIEYTGSLIYDPASERVYRNISSTDIQYVGPPTPEIDAAWDTLLKDEWPVLTDEEALPFLPELKRLPSDNRYHFEPDMFHSLHCLNVIRQGLDKDYYNNLPDHKVNDINKFLKQKDFDRLHMDHCIDRLRQGIMCHGDLSPSPMYSWKGFILALGRGSQHTCRKWQPVRDWATERTRYYRELDDKLEAAKEAEKHE